MISCNDYNCKCLNYYWCYHEYDYNQDGHHQLYCDYRFFYQSTCPMKKQKNYLLQQTILLSFFNCDQYPVIIFKLYVAYNQSCYK